MNIVNLKYMLKQDILWNNFVCDFQNGSFCDVNFGFVITNHKWKDC